ncbi:MAG: hypothetical protein J0L92_06885 [Deltaproteobacteria bacterium]|nr:hypothetical protein [Deltaproteobacteria bacterium]
MRRSPMLALVLLVLLACEPMRAPMDATVDAGLDAPVADVRFDTRVDAGCTRVPGELVGERSIESGELPLLSWPGTEGAVALRDHHEPCAPAGRVIVIRELTAWSAQSLWHVAHTAALVAMDDVVVIDLWAADEDAMPMRTERLDSVVARYDELPDAIASDPDEQLGAIAIGGIALPIVVVLDARTLHLERWFTDPRAGEIEDAVRATQARLREQTRPPPFEPELLDGRFTRDRWEILEAMGAPYAPPPSSSNAHADDVAAAALGERLFEDASLSPSEVACSSCHQEPRSFTDARVVGRGVEDVTRNTPTLIDAAGSRWQFWDGRADTLWAQALGPIENEREMASSRLFVAHRVASAYPADYEAIFGALPPLADGARFPAEGAPGDAAWEAMRVADRDAVTRVFTNVGKAIEAYERTLVHTRGRFDRYASGELDALSVAERDGLLAFFQGGCPQCHWGPRLANDAFFAIDMPGVGEGALGDQGRIAAFDTLAASETRAQGAYSDDRTTPDPLDGLDAFPERMRGAFRTPTLRALGDSAPYGHAGTFMTLRSVVEHYARVRRPHTPDPRVIGVRDPHLIGFEDGRIASIVAFLEAL